MRRIAVIGLGAMGSGVALRLIEAGHHVVVHDIDPTVRARFAAMGAVPCGDVASTVANVDLLFSSLPGPPEFEVVASRVEGVAPGTTWFDLSTNSPTVVRHWHAALSERGVTLLDSPVSGGPHAAREGNLALWVSGDVDAFHRAESVLRILSPAPRYVGASGHATVAKLVHNAAGYAIQAALAEVFTLGVRAGVPPWTLWETVREGAVGRRRTFDGLQDQYLRDVYEPAGFALSLAHKDLTLAVGLGNDVGVWMPAVEHALAELAAAIERGWGHMDARVAMRLQNERAGVVMSGNGVDAGLA